MPEIFVITILGIAGAILTSAISFALGKSAERQKQSLLIRAEMLKPINPQMLFSGYFVMRLMCGSLRD
jgi:hypothetical protein